MDFPQFTGGRSLIVHYIFQGKEILGDGCCPVCNGGLVMRFRRDNGRPFWGCRSYPNCKGVKPIYENEILIVGYLGMRTLLELAQLVDEPEYLRGEPEYLEAVRESILQTVSELSSAINDGDSLFLKSKGA